MRGSLRGARSPGCGREQQEEERLCDRHVAASLVGHRADTGSFRSSRGGHFQRTSEDVKTLQEKGRYRFRLCEESLLYMARNQTGIEQDQNMGASTAPPRRAYVQALDQGA